MHKNKIEAQYNIPIKKLSPERLKIIHSKIYNSLEKQNSTIKSFNISGDNTIIDKIIQQTERNQRQFDRKVRIEKSKLHNKLVENLSNTARLKSITSDFTNYPSAKKSRNGYYKIIRISRMQSNEIRIKKKITGNILTQSGNIKNWINKDDKGLYNNSIKRYDTEIDNFLFKNSEILTTEPGKKLKNL